MTTSGNKQPVAVIVGAGINGLGVLRSLARGRVSAIVLDSDASQPAMRSRYGRKIIIDGREPTPMIRTLEQLANELDGRKALLILTQEHAVSCVSAYRERLDKAYRLVLPPHDVLTDLMHKEGFRAMATAAGAVIPQTLQITSAEQTADINRLNSPLVVKPAVRSAAYSAAFSKAYRVDTVSRAQALVNEILPILPDVVVQEWIDGADSDIYFCLQYIASSGDMAASFVGRKIRSWPPGVGGTASCAPASAQVARQLVERTTAFFKYAGVLGFASMEYKRDTRSGEFFMVEPTVGRTDYQEEVATLNDVNIPLAACQAEFGMPLEKNNIRKSGVIWRDRTADIQSKESGADTDPWSPQQAQTINALWRATDPIPAASHLAGRIKKRLWRVGARMVAVTPNKTPEP